MKWIVSPVIALLLLVSCSYSSLDYDILHALASGDIRALEKLAQGELKQRFASIGTLENASSYLPLPPIVLVRKTKIRSGEWELVLRDANARTVLIQYAEGEGEPEIYYVEFSTMD